MLKYTGFLFLDIHSTEIGKRKEIIKMKKTYILEDLDCAHCAAIIEEKVGKLEGVSQARLTLLTQKLVIEAEEEKISLLTEEIKKIVKKVEPDVEVIEK